MMPHIETPETTEKYSAEQITVLKGVAAQWRVLQDWEIYG